MISLFMPYLICSRLHLITFMILLLFVAGCGEDSPKPTTATGQAAKVKKVKKAKKKSVLVKKSDAELKEKIMFVYSYDPSGKKDPFFPILVEKVVKKDDELAAAGTESEPKTFLETLDISQLKLVAVMLLGSKNVAMVEDQDGKGHPVYIGTPMGKNGGIVVGIEKDKVLLEEKFKKGGEIVPVIKEIVIQSAEVKRR